MRQAKEKYQAIFENAIEGIFQATPTGVYLTVNPALARIFGYDSPAELTANAAAVVHPLYVDANRRGELQRLIEEKNAVIGFESQVHRKDGAVIWISENVRVLRDRHGQCLYYEGSVVDISERRCAEEQVKASFRQETLLKEIQHRVKNNLQVVASLFSLQADHVRDPQTKELLKESQNRVNSIAIVHEKLYRSTDLTRVNSASYLEGLTSYLFNSYGASMRGVTLHITCDDVALNMETATPCGLILQELLSNSLKYAFPSKRNDEIRVSLRKLDDQRFVLTVGDNGIGFPKDLDFRNTTTLGLQLVVMLTEQLNGTIELDREGGTTFHVTFQEQQYKVRW